MVIYVDRNNKEIGFYCEMKLNFLNCYELLGCR